MYGQMEVITASMLTNNVPRGEPVDASRGAGVSGARVRQGAGSGGHGAAGSCRYGPI